MDTLFFYFSQTMNIFYKWLTRLLLFVVRLTNALLFIALLLVASAVIAVIAFDAEKNDGELIIYILNMLLANGVSGVFRRFYSFMSSAGLISHIPFAIGGAILLLFILKIALNHLFQSAFLKQKNIQLIIHNFIKLFINIFILVFACIFYFNFIFTGYIDGIFDGSETIGKKEYLKKLQAVEEYINNEKAGAVIALNKVIFDVTENGHILDALDDEQYLNFCIEINKLIDQIGGPYTEFEHYFRNKINRAPKTLDEMVDAINFGKNWILMSPEDSVFHMNGEDGEFNIKFVSADGIFEAVYNKSGELLTEENGALNMGTYNYADPLTNSVKHGLYDVAPYFMWGNDKSGFTENKEDNVKKFKNNPLAIEAYERLKSRIFEYAQ